MMVVVEVLLGKNLVGVLFMPCADYFMTILICALSMF